MPWPGFEVLQNTKLLCPTPISFLKQIGLDATPLVFKVQINALMRVGWQGKEESMYSKEYLRQAFNPLSAQERPRPNRIFWFRQCYTKFNCATPSEYTVYFMKSLLNMLSHFIKSN